MCFQCHLLSLFAAQKGAWRQKMHFPPQLKTTSLRHLFLQVTALWHTKIIKWMSPILLIEWGQHPLGRKRENNMQSCGHRLHIWDILQLWNIWFFGWFTKPWRPIFACCVRNSALSTLFFSHTFCLSQLLPYICHGAEILWGRKYVYGKIWVTTSTQTVPQQVR